MKITLNHALLEEMLEGIGTESMRELMAFYMEETRVRAPEMRAFFDDGNFSELKRSAHSLKGASNTYGLTTLADVAAKLEQAADNEDAAAALEPLAWIEENSEDALSALSAYVDGNTGPG